MKGRTIRRTSGILTLLTAFVLSSPIQPLKNPGIQITEEAQDSLFDYLTEDITKFPDEFPICAEGRFENNNYLIESFKLPRVQYADSKNALFDLRECYSERYLGLAHRHPNTSCEPSVKDAKRFRRDKRAELEIIACDAAPKDSLGDAEFGFKWYSRLASKSVMRKMIRVKELDENLKKRLRLKRDYFTQPQYRLERINNIDYWPFDSETKSKEKP